MLITLLVDKVYRKQGKDNMKLENNCFNKYI